VDLTQHEGLPERFGQCVHQPPDRARVPLAQDMRLRRFRRLAPQRRLPGVLGDVLDPSGRRTGAAGIFGVADIAQDREQPGLIAGPR